MIVIFVQQTPTCVTFKFFIQLISLRTVRMPCDFPLAVVFATSTSGHFVKLKIHKIFQVYKRTEFNKTIIPFALVGYDIGYNQLSPTGLVGYLPSHIHCALMEQLLNILLFQTFTPITLS